MAEYKKGKSWEDACHDAEMTVARREARWEHGGEDAPAGHMEKPGGSKKPQRAKSTKKCPLPSPPARPRRRPPSSGDSSTPEPKRKKTKRCGGAEHVHVHIH